ncbi:hypothetical protein STEG23_027115, partial [Scotinomys teguina]
DVQVLLIQHCSGWLFQLSLEVPPPLMFPMTVTPLGRDQDCSLKNREPDVPAPWFLDPGGWSKTTAVRLFFIFPGICTLSLTATMLDCCCEIPSDSYCSMQTHVVDIVADVTIIATEFWHHNWPLQEDSLKMPLPTNSRKKSEALEVHIPKRKVVIWIQLYTKLAFMLEWALSFSKPKHIAKRKAEENDLKKSLMKMLEEAFEEKMKNVSKEIGENTNKKLEEINKEIEEKKSKKLEEMNNEIEEKKNKKLEEMNNEIEEKKNKRVEEMNKEIEEKRNKKLQELDKEIEEKINKKLKEMNKEIEEKTNKKLEEINKVIEEKTNKKLDEINKEIEDKTNKKLEKINKEIDGKKNQRTGRNEERN